MKKNILVLAFMLTAACGRLQLNGTDVDGDLSLNTGVPTKIVFSSGGIATFDFDHVAQRVAVSVHRFSSQTPYPSQDCSALLLNGSYQTLIDGLKNSEIVTETMPIADGGYRHIKIQYDNGQVLDMYLTRNEGTGQRLLRIPEDASSLLDDMIYNDCVPY